MAFNERNALVGPQAMNQPERFNGVKGPGKPE
jgi:hypothetical protein